MCCSTIPYTWQRYWDTSPCNVLSPHVSSLTLTLLMYTTSLCDQKQENRQIPEVSGCKENVASTTRVSSDPVMCRCVCEYNSCHNRRKQECAHWVRRRKVMQQYARGADSCDILYPLSLLLPPKLSLYGCGYGTIRAQPTGILCTGTIPGKHQKQ